MTETTPSLPASGHGEVAGLVEELRAGLEGVTPGPWRSVGGILEDDDEGNSRFFVRPVKSEGWQVVQTFGPHGSANAAHIARCSPDNIAKLLDHIAALAAQLAAPTPSPVEARADGVREAIERLAFGYELMHQTLCHIAGTSGADRHWYTQKAGEVTERITRVGEVTGSSNPGKPGDCLRGYRQFLAALESTPAQPVREHVER